MGWQAPSRSFVPIDQRLPFLRSKVARIAASNPHLAAYYDM